MITIAIVASVPEGAPTDIPSLDADMREVLRGHFGEGVELHCVTAGDTENPFHAGLRVMDAFWQPDDVVPEQFREAVEDSTR